MAVTDWKAPQTAANVDRDGKQPWADVDNAKVDDENYSACAPDKATYGDWLRLTNFGFTAGDIPVGATIDGIEVQYKRLEIVSGDKVCDSALYLRKTAGQVGDNKASATEWDTSKETVTYGGAADKWGTTWATTDIVAVAGFGVDLSALNTDAFYIQTAEIFYCQIRIYYTPPAADHRKSSFFKMF